jgi:hypothetical protein
VTKLYFVRDDELFIGLLMEESMEHSKLIEKALVYSLLLHEISFQLRQLVLLLPFERTHRMKSQFQLRPKVYWRFRNILEEETERRLQN